MWEWPKDAAHIGNCTIAELYATPLPQAGHSAAAHSWGKGVGDLSHYKSSCMKWFGAFSCLLSVRGRKPWQPVILSFGCHLRAVQGESGRGAAARGTLWASKKDTMADWCHLYFITDDKIAAVTIGTTFSTNSSIIPSGLVMKPLQTAAVAWHRMVSSCHRPPTSNIKCRANVPLPFFSILSSRGVPGPYSGLHSQPSSVNHNHTPHRQQSL
mmetsp:Transcript_7483/g.21144  ORF Transcript_7483/g.21144 Transcript_7483/m.21144 type:complete len:212 (-) Transcript_7483:492-1127(-)